MSPLELDGLEQAEAITEEQLREIMKLYGEEVWNYIYFLTKNSDQADELTQEVFIKCYYRIRTYRGASSLKTWLFTIARNTVFTYRKSRFYRSGLWGGVQPLAAAGQEQLAAAGGGSVSRSAEMEYLGNRQADEIWSLIMKLPDKLREVLVLDLKAELTIREIAGLMQISPGTVKSRLHRARKLIQDKLRRME
ncbi:sigma-70 family RNA polymerase sigma factor [Paenibacillus sp. MMS20-IR301]|uniref:RNA polymerase sigma factor n=1 Tax=Paenibacillus sp. MMS20-IR301 TaxID=2895946 RepID=UPI0028E60416|nr:sigma-70 family RNA polymerase sigma factor [Paenibacillus sp. MMS20-IR301]WNS43385.1 sigma-70 family RNA polymerase sigma factor [Paenibacillus sp. MMS20-IR301]